MSTSGERPTSEGPDAVSDGRPETSPELIDDGRGALLLKASWAGTVAFAVANLLGVVAIDLFAPVVVVLSVVMFTVGTVLFFVAYARAVGRSRAETLGVGGIYFLSGSAPANVRRGFMTSFASQCLIVVVVIALRPFTSLVLGALAPVYGLGCSGVWGARYGWFPPRVAKGDKR